MDQHKKEFLGFMNSVVWFSMDASWMLAWNYCALFLIAPTLITGFWLFLIEKRKDIKLADLATLCWIAMNCGWLISEVLEIPSLLWVSKISMGLGVLLLVLCFYLSDDIQKTLQEFRRFRLKQLRGFANQKL